MTEQLNLSVEGACVEEAFLFPASHAQQQMWFLDTLVGHQPVYNYASAVRLSGVLQEEQLQLALTVLMERHESLRTRFQMIDGKLMQVIMPTCALPLVLHDMTEQHYADVEKQAVAVAKECFDLVNGPLVRSHLFKMTNTDHLLMISMHHIITDGWSMSILLDELTSIYDAALRGVEPNLLEVGLQYADYSEWQHEYLQGEVLQRLIQYWKAQLEGSDPLLDLPFDHLRPVEPSYQGGVHRFRINREQTAGLHKLGKQEDATLYMTLMAAFQALLFRYTNQEDVLVGSPIANRNQAELERVVGCVINTLVIRGHLQSDMPFVELLRQIRNTTLDAYQHQDLPFGRLIEELQPERVHGITPIFQTMLVVQNMPPMRWELSGLTVEPVEIHNGLAKFDLLLTVVEETGELNCFFEYATDLFDAATIEQLTTHFLQLINGILQSPEQEIACLPLLSEQEQQLLTPVKNYKDSGNCLLHKRFEQQVILHPEKVAVEYDNHTLTYRALNERANQLAHYLRARGVGPDARVGILLERSLEMLVAILGVLKAGGGYVPLDPTIPRDRLEFILEDAELPLLIIAGNRADWEQSNVDLVDLKSDAVAIAIEPITAPKSGVEPHHLAYVIYTSGSTGKPKGVVIPHQNVIRLFDSTEHWFSFDESDVWTLFHSYAFDFSVWEIWGALLYGGKLVVVPYMISRSPDAFYKLLIRQQVTVLNQTPSAFRQLIQLDLTEAERQALALRYVVFGGEALELSMLKEWFDKYGDQKPRLINMYGITETTVHVTYRPITRNDLTQSYRSLIGEAIPDMSVHVLDKLGQQVPIGVVGEIYVGGAGLAREYLKRPDLTSQRFVPLPTLPGERLYKTGDLARRLRNGDIEYKGRIDDQVKIRGFRIELGEIESACLQHPNVREAFVSVHVDETGKRLIAYLAVDMRSGLIADIRQFLKTQLPVYMVPSFYVLLDKIPLNSNGKIDRKALAAIAIDTTRAAKADYIAPTTEEEQLLCDVFAQVLGLERVGIEDHYFALGGDSILSLRVQAELHKRGYQLALQDLFREPSVCALAQTLIRIEENPQPTTSLNSPFALVLPEDRKLLPDCLDDAYPATMLQLGMIYHSDLQASSQIYTNLHEYCLQAPFSLHAWDRALTVLINRHPILRTSFDLHRFTWPLQLVHREVSVPLTVKDLRDLSHEEQERYLAEHHHAELKMGIDWSQAPLLRVSIHRLSDEQFQLSLLEHHAILDGWSVASMFTELFRLYSAFISEQTPMLPAQPVSTYRDFVEVELSTLADEGQARYWREALAGAPVHELPRLEGPHRVGKPTMSVTEVDLPEDLSDQLKELANSLRVPIKSVLFAAHLAALKTLGGSEDLVTGLVSNGRVEGQDSDRALGVFLNTLPFRIRMTAGSWKDLISLTFAQEQELLSYRRYPLAKIQEVVGSSKLFEVAFNFIHFHVTKELDGMDNVAVLHNTEHSFDNHTLVTNFMLDVEEKRVRLQFQVDNSQLSDWQVSNISEIYLEALRHMVADPTARYDEQCLLGSDEWNWVVARWNNTDVDLPIESTLHAWIEQQASHTPDRVALQFAQTCLTYRDLNERSNQLAHTLRRRGGLREDRVGICMVRSLEMVIALVGTLKAGMAYVPLDPEYPEERLRYMMEDSAVKIVLSHLHTHHISEKLVADSEVSCIDLTDWNSLHMEDVTNPENDVRAEDLAYVIYTSGSTGRPKGVLMPHRGVVNRLLWGQDLLPLTQQDRVLQKTPYSFDISVWEFFWPLFVGATLVIAKPDGHKDPDYLVQLIQQEKITTVHFVPTMLSYFLSTPGVEGCIDLKRVFCSGEELPTTSVECFFERMPEEVRLYNFYGPTEAAIEVSYFECKRGEKRSRIPIGYAGFNSKLYVLDQQLKPVPIGVPGELHIGGVQLARGYQSRPDLTSEKFIFDPFSAKPGARIYKTGDLARLLQDGAIEFLGRIDQQVKLRGMRIELGEIETLLLQQPEIDQAIVVLKEVSSSVAELVAYVVPQDFTSFSPQKVALQLKQKLPTYMVPSYFHCLDAIPMLPNGKVNRRALTELELHQSNPRTERNSPVTPSEKRIADIWSEVLGVVAVSRDDNFFDLGGQSLLAIRIISRVREAFSIAVPLQSLFEYPTVIAFAEYLDSLKQEVANVAVEPTLIPRIERKDDLSLTHRQEQMWLLEQLEPNTAQHNVPVPLRLKGKLNVEALTSSLQSMVNRHEILRTTFHSRAGRPILQMADELPVKLPEVDLTTLPPEEQEQKVKTLVMEMFLMPFQLSQGPLFRFLLIRLSAEEHVLAATFHHLIFDGGSIRLYLDEFAREYAASVRDTTLLLPAMPIQFVDYAAWHNLRVQLEEAQHLDYWTHQLANLTSDPLLKPDRPRRVDGVREGEMVTYRLPSDTVEALEKFSRENGVTLFMTTLAAFQLLLFGESGQTDIAVGTPGENRNRPELEHLMGCFVNSLVLRTDLSGNPTFSGLLDRVREVTTNAYQHQELPYEMVMSALQTKRGYNPLFQVLFVLHGHTDLPRKLADGLMLEHFSIDNRPPKFDLHFDLEPMNDEIIGTVTYDCTLFNRSTIENLIRRYQQILILLLKEPDVHIERLLELLQQSEYEHLREKRMKLQSRLGIRNVGKNK